MLIGSQAHSSLQPGGSKSFWHNVDKKHIPHVMHYEIGIYTIETGSILLQLSPTFLQGIRDWLQPEAGYCMCSINSCGSISKPSPSRSLPALYNHMFLLHGPQCHLPSSFASTYISLVFSSFPFK